MAVLGKRKAREAPSVSEDDAAAIFRRHFESQFLPLAGAKPKATKPTASVEQMEDEETDSDDSNYDNDDKDDEHHGEDSGEWGGLSDDDSEDEEVPTIEVVDHSSSQTSKPTAMSKRERKAFMSSRPPEQISLNAEATTTTTTPSTSSDLPEDAPSLLAQDLELRRLLAESHLLAPALTAAGNPVAPKAFAAGRTRHKATDLRVQALGSKMSIHKQEKMPMNMRKGIVAAAGARETKRRKEAKENGIILERETGKKPSRRSKGRDLGVHRPGVGRLKGAELKISDRDVRKIESGRDAFGRRGR